MSVGSVSWGSSPWDPIAAARQAQSAATPGTASPAGQADAAADPAGAAATQTASSIGNALLATLLQLRLDPQDGTSPGEGAPPAPPAGDSASGTAAGATGTDAAAGATARVHHGHHHHHAPAAGSASDDTAGAGTGAAATDATGQDTLPGDVAGILKQLSRVLDAYAANGAAGSTPAASGSA